MRARQLLPAAVVLFALLTFTGCANGSGLRVEGAEPAGTTTTPATASTEGTQGFGKTDRTPAKVTVSLTQVRQTLLADKSLDTYSRTVLSKCLVIERCLSRGATVNVLHSAQPQLVVLIHTIEGFTFGAFLIAVEPAGPRRVWSLKADQLKINASPQGDLVVESEMFGPEDKACCPSVTRVEVYRWNGRQMIKVSSQDQKGD
ncbi:hypothetical protein F1D05_28725 [Kribbella qitaiheensis]|uniref:LppP/LprE family lipoprotein n=1 Tax=Kribbella qitaiheensis TaxID=1544730 RepID=A0A7G6X4K2_9ACTN|nr:hypothetical protein [Kribbella qitaiheensis]QNE21167.1 hypothetical protein F1D05_28725 [Kribbella qitaiheensis]